MPEFLFDAWSQNIHPFLTSYWSEIVLLILLGFTIRHSDDTNPFADLSNSLSKTALDALKDTFDKIGKSLRLDSPDDHAKTISKHLSKVFKDFYSKADSLLKTSTENIKNHFNNTILVFGNDKKTRTWRVAGAVIAAILLGIFFLLMSVKQHFLCQRQQGFLE